MNVTGEQLYQEICTAAARAGKSLAAFARPLFPDTWKIEQLRIARYPTATTIARVRALIAGEPLPPPEKRLGLTRLDAEEAGMAPSRRSIREAASLSTALDRQTRLERARDLAEAARATRKPGQCVADRLREIRAEQVAA